MHDIPPQASNPSSRSLYSVRSALVTAGPTEEPIDAVRFLGNRSSGRLGLAIAKALADRGVPVTLLLGPIRVPVPADPRVTVLRFRTAAELEALLRRHLPQFDLVVMAAAVADYRPKKLAAGKLRRDAESLTIELEGVPDLLATTRELRKPGARVIGFALEPRERLESSAREKLERKDLTGIVANPLETMDADGIDGTLFLRDGRVRTPGGVIPKPDFARWLAAELTSEYSATAH